MEMLYYPHYLSLVVTLICSITQLTALTTLIKHTKSIMSGQPSIIVAYISVTSYSIFSLGWFILSIYGLSVSDTHFDVISICSFEYSLPFFFEIGKALLFIFYIIRLFQIFNRTPLQYRKFPLIILSICIVFGYILSTACFSILTFWSDLETVQGASHGFHDCDMGFNSNPYRNVLVYTGISLTLITDLVASIVILRLYLKNLVILSYMFDHVKFKNQEQKHKNEEFMKLSMKTTHLVIVSILTEYITLIVNGTALGVYWLSIDHTINVICICFSFADFDQQYHRLCCYADKYCTKCCTHLCYKCCIRSNIKDIMNAPVIESSKSSKTDANKKLEFSTINVHQSKTETNGENIKNDLELKHNPSNQQLNDVIQIHNDDHLTTMEH